MRSRTLHRRGTAYVAVLALAMLVVAIGMGTMLVARSELREANLRNDEGEARAAAEATIDWALQQLATDPSWRNRFANNTYTPEVALGPSRVRFKLVDEGDGALSDCRLESVRLYSLARSGQAARSYSVLLEPSGPTLDVLRFPLYTGDDLTIIGFVRALGGPVVSADVLTVSTGATLDGSAECRLALSLLGTVMGTVKTGVPARTLPQQTTFEQYLSEAVAIDYSSLPAGGKIFGRILSPTSNPFGFPNPRGVYSVTVPAGGRLSISESRLECTLVVRLGTGSQLVLSGTYHWEAPSLDKPALIVKGEVTSVVSLGGSLSPLDEGTKSQNFNPAASPYAGVSDADTNDCYATSVRGLIHIIGCGATLTDYFSLRGCAVVEGSVTLSNGARLQADPILYASPARWYFDPALLSLKPSTWQREEVLLP
jgi:hypothetical protein